MMAYCLTVLMFKIHFFYNLTVLFSIVNGWPTSRVEKYLKTVDMIVESALIYIFSEYAYSVHRFIGHVLSKRFACTIPAFDY